jgi:hypothetical protein
MAGPRTTYLKASPSGPDEYGSLELWNAGEQKDLPANTEDHTLLIDAGTWETVATGFVIAGGWIANSTYNITVKPAPGAEHNGIRSTGVIISCAGTANSDTTWQAFNWMTLQDVTLRKTGGGIKRCLKPGMAVVLQGNGFLAQRIIMDGGPSTNATEAILMNGYAAGFTVPSAMRNCLIFGGVASSTPSRQWTIDNCVMTGNFECVVGQATQSADFKVRNTYAGTWTGSSNALPYGTFSNNAGTDALAPGTSPQHNVVANNAFTNPAGNDYTLKTGSVLIGAGVSRSPDFTDDIARLVR